MYTAKSTQERKCVRCEALVHRGLRYAFTQRGGWRRDYCLPCGEAESQRPLRPVPVPAPRPRREKAPPEAPPAAPPAVTGALQAELRSASGLLAALQEVKAALPWAAAALALAGAVLNVQKNPAGFALWTVSNAYLVVYNIRRRERAQASLFVAYLGLSLWGLWSWL